MGLTYNLCDFCASVLLKTYARRLYHAVFVVERSRRGVGSASGDNLAGFCAGGTAIAAGIGSVGHVCDLVRF